MSKKNQTSMFKRESFNEKVSWIVRHLLIPLDHEKKWFSSARAMASRLPIDMMKYYEMEWKDEIEQTNAAILESGKGPLGSIWQFYANRWWEYKAYQERLEVGKDLVSMSGAMEQRGLKLELGPVPDPEKTDMINRAKLQAQIVTYLGMKNE